jgi:hypothetical protein
MDNKTIQSLLNEASNTLDRINSKIVKSQKEVDLKAIIESIFNLTSNLLEDYKVVRDANEEDLKNPNFSYRWTVNLSTSTLGSTHLTVEERSPSPEPTASAFTNSTNNLNTRDEAMAFGTGMALAGITPAHLNSTPMQVEPPLEEQQLEDFHAMMAELEY